MSRFWSKKNSFTPEFLAEQEKLCKAFIDGLAKAIKELQLMFAEEDVEEIQDCRATQRLCTWFEHVLMHGLKPRLFSQTASFWPLAIKISRKQAIDQLKSLQYAHSELGRSRAWIKLAVNECSLESYINVLVHDKQLLNSYYEQYSFMRNEELTGAMARLLIGLSQIVIQLQVDTMNLEFDTPLEAMHAPVKKLTATSSSAGVRVPRKTEEKQKGAGNEPLSEAELEKLLKEAESFTVSSVKKSPVPALVEPKLTLVEETNTLEEQIQDKDPFPEFPFQRTETAKSILSGRTSPDKSAELPTFHYTTEEEPIETLATEEAVLNWEVDDEKVVSGYGVPPSGHIDTVGPPQREETVEDKSGQISNSDFAEKKSPKSESPPDASKNPLSAVGNEYEEKTFFDTHNEDNGLNFTVDETRITELESTRKPNEPTREDGGVTGSNPFDDNDSDDEQLEGVGGGGEGVGEGGEGVGRVEGEEGVFGDRKHIVGEGEGDVDISTGGGHRQGSPVATEEGLSGGEDWQVQGKQVTVAGGEWQEETNIQLTSPEQMLSPSMWFGDEESVRQRMRLGTTEHRSVEVSKQYSQVLEDLTTMLDKGEESDLEECLYEYDIVELTQALQEDHFSKEPTMNELKGTIARIKLELKSLSEETPQERRLVLQDKLVKYQVALHWMAEIHSSGILRIMDHQFIRQKKGLVRGVSCDMCGGGILGIIRSWYRCQECHIASHKSCLVYITRKCVYEKAQNAKLILQICPRQGLIAQHFRCSQCNKAIGIGRSKIPTAKLCDYTGKYFCRDCYHKETTVIPARVVHNWDFVPRGVSSEAYELLQVLYTKPLIQISKTNPKLYTYVQALKDIEILRRDIVLMKVYLLTCTDALKKRLLLKLERYPHFKESADMFSMQDLVLVLKGRLLTDVQEIHRTFAHHIKEDCSICFQRGSTCVICGSDEVIFPFDKQIVTCGTCLSLFHKICIGNSACSYCSRQQSRSGTSSPTVKETGSAQRTHTPHT